MRLLGQLPRHGSVTWVATATPEQIWAVLSDPGRTGEWSHEAVAGEWVDGATGPEVGARFIGPNRNGAMRWTRRCEIAASVEPTELAWQTVPTRLYRDSTEWRFLLTPVEGGTRIDLSFRMVQLSPLASRLLWLIVPSHRDRLPRLTGDLQRLAAAAAAS